MKIKSILPFLLLIVAMAVVVVLVKTTKVPLHPVVKADPAACKVAMVKQLKEAMDTGKRGDKPKECYGLDDQELEKLANEVLSEYK